VTCVNLLTVGVFINFSFRLLVSVLIHGLFVLVYSSGLISVAHSLKNSELVSDKVNFISQLVD